MVGDSAGINTWIGMGCLEIDCSNDLV
jgi:hypothetical protein